MTEEEKKVIKRFAAGDVALRNEAIRIHRQYISILGVRGTPEMRFMAETDTSCPDFNLRGIYRKALLNSK